MLVGGGGEEADAQRFVANRLRASGQDAGAALAVLALGMGPFSPADLADVLGWTEARAKQACEELSVRGLTVESSGAHRPAHDLIRAAAAADLSDPMRRRTHRALAPPGSRTRQAPTCSSFARPWSTDEQAGSPLLISRA